MLQNTSAQDGRQKSHAAVADACSWHSQNPRKGQRRITLKYLISKIHFIYISTVLKRLLLVNITPHYDYLGLVLQVELQMESEKSMDILEKLLSCGTIIRALLI